jgi:hypothetical protein
VMVHFFLRATPSLRGKSGELATVVLFMNKGLLPGIMQVSEHGVGPGWLGRNDRIGIARWP